MKKIIKNSPFWVGISFFTLNFMVMNSFAMEEQQTPQNSKKSPLPLTALAANAYINHIQQGAKNKQEAALAIKQELKEKCPLATEEIQQIINQQISRDNIVLEQPILEKIICTLPDSNQFVTENELWPNTSEGNEISFWKKYSPVNKNMHGLLAGMASTMPGATQALENKSIFKEGQWCKIHTLKVPDTYKIKFASENILIFIVESELNSSNFNKIALFTKNDNAFEEQQGIEMKHSIKDCTFSIHDNLLACALTNKNIVMFHYDAHTHQWQQRETIRNAAPMDYGIENIAFLQQPYEKNPTLFVHNNPMTINDDISPEIVSLWRFDNKQWQLNEEILKGINIKVYTSPDSKRIIFHYFHSETYEAKTMIMQTAENRNPTYTKKEYDEFRHFSPDGILSLMIKDICDSNTFHNSIVTIIDCATENIVRTIQTKSYFSLPFFINNNTIANTGRNYSKIFSLSHSTDFALCKQVLQEAQEQENVDLTAFLDSPLTKQLSAAEKQHITNETQKIKEQRSLKTKFNQLRSKCRNWTFNHPYSYMGIRFASYLGTAIATMYLHSKLDPKFSYWKAHLSLFKDPTYATTQLAYSHAFAALLLQTPLSYLFGPVL